MRINSRTMKKIVLKTEIALLCLAVLAVSVLFSSCGNDESENIAKTTQSTIASSAVEESTAVSTSKTTAKTTEENTTKATAKKTSAATESSTASNSSQSPGTDAYKRYLKLFKTVPGGGSVTLRSADVSKGYLILVNNDHKYNSSQSQDFIEFEDLENRSFYVAYSGLEADRFTAQQFNSMNRQYLNNKGSKLTVCSSYRSVKKQTQLFNDSVARQGEEETLKWYTRPGCSEHHTGFAIDYNTSSFGDKAFTGKGNQSYIREICDNYGFILRYTAEKRDITGVAPEAWHFRQVGIPHAAYIMQNGLCLEEYIDLVKKYTADSPLTVSANGQTYYIFYVKSDGDSTKVNLSGYSSYLSSGNNIDGFIITAIK